MADGRKNNKGTKGNKGGRPPKADEIKKLELMDSVAAPKEVWEKLWQVAEQGDVQALRVWIEHRYGKPKEQKDITTNGNDINLTPIEFVD